MGPYRCMSGGALLLALSLASPAAFAQGAAQTAPVQTLPDRLPDVVANALPADEVDVLATRLPRVRRCLIPDAWSPDPTGKFNQAYYEELTGRADYYDTIRQPPPKIKFSYPGAIHPDGMAFANLDRVNSVAAASRMSDLFELPSGNRSRSVGGTPGSGRDNCGHRTGMEKDVAYARALAKYDKGDYAAALAALEADHARVRRSPHAGEMALMIAGMYMRGQGTEKNPQRAIAWLEEAVGAALSGSRTFNLRYNPEEPDRFYTVRSEAAMALGLIYLTGNGVPKDEKLARRWVEVAMRDNHVPAYKIAADMYYTGFGGGKNLRDALMHYEVAAGARHARAAYSTGSMFAAGEGARADTKLALMYFRTAAALGDADAAYALAVAYERGEGVAADPDLALSLYKIAAVEGVPEAQNAIGTYFYDGASPLGQDYREARAWFEEAAIRGDADGMFNLAAMQIRGEGGDADPVKAWAWLNLARQGGREDAAAGLAALETRLGAEDLRRAKALVGPAA